MDGERTAWVKMSPWVTLHFFPFPLSCTCLKCAVNWHRELPIWMTAAVLRQSSCPSSLLSIFDSLVFPGCFLPASPSAPYQLIPCWLPTLFLSSSSLLASLFTYPCRRPLSPTFSTQLLFLSLTSEVLYIVIFHYEMRHSIKLKRFDVENKPQQITRMVDF